MNIYEKSKHVSGIYLITDTINEVPYIGQTIDIESRRQQHIREVLNQNGDQTQLYCAMRRFGLNNFDFDIIEECQADENILNYLERYWIEYYDSYEHGYNMTRGGQGKDSWIYNPQKIRDLWDEGFNIKQIQNILGCSQQLVSERLRGYNDYNKETARARYTYLNNGAGPIYQYSLMGDFIQEYPNATIAAKKINNSRNDTILACLNNKINSAYGFQWSLQKVDKLTPVAVPHGKLVQCIETQEVFTSTREAARFYNLSSHSNIVECCNGKKKSAGKHKITGEKLHWKYYEP